MKSSKELSIDADLIDRVLLLGLSGKALTGLKHLLACGELRSLQEYANTVSIVRLGFNDHGPVHMRIITHNAVIMLELLKKAGIKTSLEKDGCGDFEDSLLAVILSAICHDVGMCMGRAEHEVHSAILAIPVIDRALDAVYKDDAYKKTMVKSLALEGIRGHMGTIGVSSLEAGVVQIADGCDMTKGRARIPIALNYAPRSGHIHQYSANSIEKVKIWNGGEKPIRIDVLMSSEVGIFQVEEVLLHKISKSTAKEHIELYAQVCEQDVRRYL